MCLATSSNLLRVLQDAPELHFFHILTIFWSAEKQCKDTFLHPPSPFPCTFCNCNSGSICIASQFYFHCYIQSKAMPAKKLAWKWCCDLSRLLARNITKGIHLGKPALLNCPTMLSSWVHRLPGPNCWRQLLSYFLLYCKESALIESHQLSWYCGCTLTTPKYKTPQQLFMTVGKTWPTLWPSKRLFLFILYGRCVEKTAA